MSECCSQMYWLELTVGRQSLMRAWMDGTHIEVFGPHPLLNMPQGLTLDLSTERLYWTQGVDNHVRSINLAGTDVQDLVAPAMSLHSPGPVSTYKVSSTWKDCVILPIGAISFSLCSHLLLMNTDP